MSKAQLAIEKMIAEKEEELNDYIRLHKDILIPFAAIRLDLTNLKAKRDQIARNRIEAVVNIPKDDRPKSTTSEK